MTTYCAPCLADLALVREAVTSVLGTASCMAHAVLLSHPSDTPQRRLTRLSELRTLAEGKLETASVEDAPALELLVQEFALAGAMDMTVPLRDLAGDRTPRPPKSRRSRGGRPDRGDRPHREGGAGTDAVQGEAGQGGDAGAPAGASDSPVAEASTPSAPATEAVASATPTPEAPPAVERTPGPAPDVAPSAPADASAAAATEG